MMTEREGIQIESLPEHILVQIFSYVENIKSLRQVSKYFKDIVDGSSTLLGKYCLNVTKCDDAFDVIPCYENMKFTDFTPQAFKFIMDYQQKGKVKYISINAALNSSIWSSFIVMQYILFKFANLQEIFFNFDSASTYVYGDRIKLLDSPHIIIRSLMIDGSGEAIFDFLLYAFSKIKSLKVLSINSNECEITFPDTDWKLEELRFDSWGGTDRNALEEFILKQTNLKVLRVWEPINSFDVIAKQLPNLERIDLRFDESVSFNSEFLSTNEIAKELAINYSSKTKSFPLDAILNHYKNIEKLYINLSRNRTKINMELPKLKFLSIIDEYTQLTVRAKFPNLKILHLRKIDSQACKAIAENLRNIEELSFEHFHDVDDFLPMLQKCTSLRYLNIGRSDLSVDLSFINKILEAVPSMRVLGISIYQLEKMETSREGFLSKVNSDRLSLKIFSYANELEDEYSVSILM